MPFPRMKRKNDKNHDDKNDSGDKQDRRNKQHTTENDSDKELHKRRLDHSEKHQVQREHQRRAHAYVPQGARRGRGSESEPQQHVPAHVQRLHDPAVLERANLDDRLDMHRELQPREHGRQLKQSGVDDRADLFESDKRHDRKEHLDQRKAENMHHNRDLVHRRPVNGPIVQNRGNFIENTHEIGDRERRKQRGDKRDIEKSVDGDVKLGGRWRKEDMRGSRIKQCRRQTAVRQRADDGDEEEGNNERDVPVLPDSPPPNSTSSNNSRSAVNPPDTSVAPYGAFKDEQMYIPPGGKPDDQSETDYSKSKPEKSKKSKDKKKEKKKQKQESTKEVLSEQQLRRKADEAFQGQPRQIIPHQAAGAPGLIPPQPLAVRSGPGHLGFVPRQVVWAAKPAHIN